MQRHVRPSLRPSQWVLVGGLCVLLTGCGGAQVPAGISAPASTSAPQVSEVVATTAPIPQASQPSSGEPSDEAVITALMAETLEQERAPVDATFTIQQLEGTYARVAAEAGGMTTYYFFKRSEDTWSIAGQVAGPVESLPFLREQGFPETMLQDLEGVPAGAAAPSGTDPLEAVYAHLGRGPDELTDEVVVEDVQGTYARVALLPEMGDGLWLFLQESKVGGWFVLTEVSMTAQPDLSTAREMGVPEELLQSIEAQG